MPKTFTFLLSCAFFCTTAHAQIWDGNPQDSTIITFSSTTNFTDNTLPMIDTSGMGLWQIGRTGKAVFQAGNPDSAGIVTDTSNPYPINANSSFAFRLNTVHLNPIVTFRHKYETTAGKDGCIVEYSNDSGATWINVKGGCNVDGGGFQGIHTANFYTVNDTLESGDTAFSGNSSGWRTSRIQFFHALPIKTTGGPCTSPGIGKWLRFRFVSDGNAESLGGWMIDQLVLEEDHYSGSVFDPRSNHASLHIFPNPASDGSFRFPVLDRQQLLNLRLYDAQGRLLFQERYQNQVQLTAYPKGLYYYTVGDGARYYAGRLVYE